MIDSFWSPFLIFLLLLGMACYGIRCDYNVKMRELDLIEKGIIKKEITNGK